MCELNEEDHRIDIPNAEKFSVYVAAKELDLELTFSPNEDEQTGKDGHEVMLHFYNDAGTGTEIFIIYHSDGTFTVYDDYGKIRNIE